MQKSDEMNYAPKGKSAPVCGKGDFRVGVIGLDHGHIFGMCNGSSNYFRVDWLTPDGLGVWGDGRTFVLGTDGYIEMRKYIDVARSKDGDQVFLIDHKGERHFCVTGQVGFPFFGRLILDCLSRTTTAYDQEMFFKAAEFAVIAEQSAIRIE